MTRAFIILLSLLLFSCTGNQEPKTGSAGNAQKSEQEIEPLITVSEAIMERGEQVYNAHCLACHQADGSGNPGMYPPLDLTETVLGDKNKLIDITLNGLTGEIEVKGEIYNQVMIPHNFLTDEQIADVLTFIRNSFGNQAEAVTPEEVAARRTQTSE